MIRFEARLRLTVKDTPSLNVLLYGQWYRIMRSYEITYEATAKGVLVPFLATDERTKVIFGHYQIAKFCSKNLRVATYPDIDSNNRLNPYAVHCIEEITTGTTSRNVSGI